MKYRQALSIAEKVKALISPHCERIEIAGNIRCKKTEVKDNAPFKPVTAESSYSPSIKSLVFQRHLLSGEELLLTRAFILHRYQNPA